MANHEYEHEPRLRGLTGLFLVACTPLLSAPSQTGEEPESFTGFIYEQTQVLEQINETFTSVKDDTTLKIEQSKVLKTKIETSKAMLLSLGTQQVSYDLEVKVALEGALKVYQQLPPSDPAQALEEIERLEAGLNIEQKPPPPSVPAQVESQPLEHIDTFGTLCPSTILEADPSYLSGHLGAANWFENKVGFDSSLEGQKLQDVLIHECAHIHQYNVYQGDVESLKIDTNNLYGGQNFEGLEANADCMALIWGASWTHYTSSCSGDRGLAAQKIINGEKIA